MLAHGHPRIGRVADTRKSQHVSRKTIATVNGALHRHERKDKQAWLTNGTNGRVSPVVVSDLPVVTSYDRVTIDF